MARYFYDRHTVATQVHYTESVWGNLSMVRVSEDATMSGYTSYNFNPATGKFSNAGNYKRDETFGYLYSAASNGSSVERWSLGYYPPWDSNIRVVETRTAIQHTDHIKGTYIDTIIAEDGTYPDNGRVGTTYWYVKKGRAFPQLSVKADGQVRQGIDGWVKVGGELKRIVQMWTKAGGQLKES